MYKTVILTGLLAVLSFVITVISGFFLQIEGWWLSVWAFIMTYGALETGLSLSHKLGWFMSDTQEGD